MKRLACLVGLLLAGCGDDEGLPHAVDAPVAAVDGAVADAPVIEVDAPPAGLDGPAVDGHPFDGGGQRDGARDGGGGMGDGGHMPDAS